MPADAYAHVLEALTDKNSLDILYDLERRLKIENVSGQIVPIAVAHNMAFDGLILAWRYGYTPALWACTLCMARPLHGKDVGGSLKYLSEYYGYQPKGVLQTKGRRLADLLPAEIAALREYNVTDVDICARLFKVFLPVTSLGELRLIDRTLRMALEPDPRLGGAMPSTKGVL